MTLIAHRAVAQTRIASFDRAPMSKSGPPSAAGSKPRRVASHVVSAIVKPAAFDIAYKFSKESKSPWGLRAARSLASMEPRIDCRCQSSLFQASRCRSAMASFRSKESTSRVVYSSDRHVSDRSDTSAGYVALNLRT